MSDTKTIRAALSAETTPGTWDKWQTWLAGLCDLVEDRERDEWVRLELLHDALYRAESAERLCVAMAERMPPSPAGGDYDLPLCWRDQVEVMKERQTVDHDSDGG